MIVNNNVNLTKTLTFFLSSEKVKKNVCLPCGKAKNLGSPYGISQNYKREEKGKEWRIHFPPLQLDIEKKMKREENSKNPLISAFINQILY